MKNFKFSIVMVFLLSCVLSLHAQHELQTATMPFSVGNITFSYYLDAEGVKVPDGEMSYEEMTGKNNNCLYTEKRTVKDGYREGEWIVQQKYPKLLHKKILSYKNGLLDGECSIENYTIDPKTKKQTLKDKEVFHFKNGHLYGENKIVNYNDTIYCNFNEAGEKIGQWKRIEGTAGDRITIAEFNPKNPENSKCYNLDILGNKTEADMGNFHIRISMPLMHFDDKFRNMYLFMPEKRRVKLPLKEDTPYGIYSSHKKLEEDDIF